ncbi:MAG: zf-HC2 domain-containing protein [Loktanella sp.]|nr:zf-HC2 domain-containing protein [Loktanella sp.]
MMSCKEVADRASAVIDGELSGWEMVQMRLHLAMCRGCRHFLGQIRAVDQLASSVTELPPEALREEALSKLRADKK